MVLVLILEAELEVEVVLPVTREIIYILVILLVKHVLPVRLQILEQVPGQPRALLVPLVYIRYHRTLKRVRPAHVAMQA